MSRGVIVDEVLSVPATSSGSQVRFMAQPTTCAGGSMCFLFFSIVHPSHLHVKRVGGRCRE
jgi:hypothetical protein